MTLDFTCEVIGLRSKVNFTKASTRLSACKGAGPRPMNTRPDRRERFDIEARSSGFQRLRAPRHGEIVSMGVEEQGEQAVVTSVQQYRNWLLRWCLRSQSEGDRSLGPRGWNLAPRPSIERAGHP